MLTTQRRPRDVRLDTLKNLMPLYDATLDPENVYPALREEWGSVAPVWLDDGVPAWLVLDWEGAAGVMREETFFSREVANWRAFHDGRVKPGSGLWAFFSDRDNAYYRDGVRRRRLRAAVDDALAAIDESDLRRDMEKACDRVLAFIVKDGATSTDLVPRYAQFVPSLTVASLCKMNDGDSDKVGQYARDIFSGTDVAGPAFVGVNGMLKQLINQRQAEYRAALKMSRDPTHRKLSELLHWEDVNGNLSQEDMRRLAQLLEYERTHPAAETGGDVLSFLVRWRDTKGRKLTDDQLLDTAQMIQSAGHEMAVAGVTEVLLYLLTHRDIEDRARRGRLDIDQVLNWVLKNRSPVQNTPARFVIADAVQIGSVFNENNQRIGGRFVHQGDAIVAAVAEATASEHRDADPVWDSENQFTLAFGVNGPHRCPAERISRIMVKVAVKKVLDRLDGLKLTVAPEDLSPGPSLWARSASSLPVTFAPVTGYDENWNIRWNDTHIEETLRLSSPVSGWRS